VRILVTGSRNWTNAQAVWAALNEQLTERGPFTLVVGDCPTGADSIAWGWAFSNGLTAEVHHADWDVHGRAAGPIRNRAMVESGADLCLAFPLGKSPGTRGCMRLAAAAGIPVKEHTP